MFEGIRVLDFTRVFSGPFCTQMLAELGADVIKIEQPDKGDETRGWYPLEQEWSGYFMALNRSKRSITLNLKEGTAIDIVKQMVKTCDVVVENFAPGVAEKLGISYEALKEIKPNLVYLSLSAYGQTGPNRKVKGYDPMIQADAGVMSLTGEEDGPPVKTMFPIADISSSLYGAFTIAAALYKRSITGEGEYIDVALYDSVVSLMGVIAAIPLLKCTLPHRMGSEHPHRVPSRNYRTSDGTYIHIICNSSQWPALCEVLDLSEPFKADPYTTDMGRLEHREEIDKQVQEALIEKTGKEWLGLLQESGVPCALVNDLDQVLNSEQANDRELLLRWNQDSLGEAVGLNFPYKFLNASTKVRKPVPKLGEHSMKILEELGYTQTEIKKLKNEGII